MSTEGLQDLAIKDRLCTLVASDLDEDPIGSANPFRRCLVLECPLPWAKEVTVSKGFPVEVMDEVKVARKDGEMPVLGIVPDPEYSVPGFTRVMMFERPDTAFSVYRKEEYLVPTDRLIPFVRALVLQAEALAEFSDYKAENLGVRDLMICTHGAHDQCCGKFGYPLYAKLRDRCSRQNGSVRAWRTSHFTGHRFSPTLIDFPQARFWGNLTDEEDVDRLVACDGLLPDLDRCYRGWAGAPYLVQYVEREMFRREGWAWTQLSVFGRVTDAWTDVGHHQPDKPVWARIDGNIVQRARVEMMVEGNPERTYEGFVEFSHMVSTLYDCIKRGQLGDSPQFQVAKLT